MNEKIASILKSKIETLSFVDKIAGLVRPVRIEVMGPNETKIQKTYPIASEVSSDQCPQKYRQMYFF